MGLNRAIIRANQILELISGSDKYLSISEISRKLKIPKSTTFDILYSLVETKFLEIADEVQRSFKIGPKAFIIGAAFVRERNIAEIAKPTLQRLMEFTNETVFLGVENSDSIIYLDKIEPQNLNLRPVSVPGSMNPLTCTGIGKAMLATYDNQKIIKRFSNKEFVIKTEHSIKSVEDLINELDKIRVRGYSVDDRESEIEMFCLAAPIYNYNKNVVAAISISGLTYKFTDEKIKSFSEELVKSALEISEKLGFVEKKLY